MWPLAFGNRGERCLMFELSVTSQEDRLVSLKAKGKIVQSDVSPFSDPLAEAIQDRSYTQRVLIDMADVEFVDSSGISWILICHKRFREAGGKLVLHSCVPAVCNILRVLKMDQILHVADDEKSAHQLCGQCDD